VGRARIHALSLGPIARYLRDVRTGSHATPLHGVTRSAQRPHGIAHIGADGAISGCATTGGACHRAGDLYQVTDALGHVTTNTAYDQAGRPTRQVDANGVITDLTYSWPKTRTVAGATTTYTYKPYGAVESVTDADGVTVTYGYDNAHRLTDITDVQGNHIHYTLDAAGNRTDEATYAVGSSSPSRHLSRTFNNLGRLTKIIDGFNHTIFDASASGAYDANGNLVTSVDALGGPWTVMNVGCDFERVPMAQWHAAGLPRQAVKSDR